MLSVLQSPRLIVPIALLPLLLGSAGLGRAQPVADTTTVDTTNLRRRLESVLDASGETERTTALAAEEFARLTDNPINVNQAAAGDLSVLPGLSAAEAHRIVHHRREHGPYDTWGSLRDVKGVSAETLHAVRPFLILGPAPNTRVFPAFNTIVSNLEFSLIQRYSRDLDLGRGYQNGRFLGPPGRLTSRLRLDYERRLQLALTLDKDPGEPLRWAPSTDTYGFDHVVGSLALRDLGPLQTLVLGDFTAQFGQGVALWQGLRFGKGRDPVSPVLQTGRGILPYRSASEANFFRGAAATVGLPGNLSLTAFASRRNRDASLDSSLAAPSGAQGSIPVRTISVSGRHRTESELARKGTFGERTAGGALEYRSSALHLGATGYYSRFNRPLRPGDKPYRRYRVAGRQASMLSAYATAYLGEYTLFGEVARAPGGTYGGLLGAALDEGELADVILLGRQYPPALANLHGNAFGDGGDPQNEIGIYTGLRLQVAENWAIGAYFDQFRAPWLRFNVPRPSSGWEARAVLEYEPRPWLSTYLQVRAQGQDEGTEYSGPGARRLEGVREERRYSARWHTEYSFSEAFTVRTRIEMSRKATPTATADGFFLSQGLRWTPHPSVQLDARMAFFDTDSFAARIYAYEHDLLYSFSVPVFFDRGRRSYILAQYEPFPSLTLEAKYGMTSYDNRSTVGSGLNQIDGSRRREIRVQVRWTLQ
jgi:DNA uptake protein ComE-like DNA-binding protein